MKMITKMGKFIKGIFGKSNEEGIKSTDKSLIYQDFKQENHLGKKKLPEKTVKIENTISEEKVLKEMLSTDGVKFRVSFNNESIKRLDFIKKRTKNRRIKNKVSKKMEKMYSHNF